MVHPRAISGNQDDIFLNQVPEWYIPMLKQMACLIIQHGAY